jgi:hypothetical protein
MAALMAVVCVAGTQDAPAEGGRTEPKATTPTVVGAGATGTATAPIDTASARAAFERFKSIQGEWLGRSTKGWEEQSGWRTIAGGSVVMHTSFDAHPNETMLTLFSLDQGRLSLTHYCVAGNQPRLDATAISRDGLEIRFTFRDGGNLPTRDRGHMDQAVFRFIDDDQMTSRWTWFQNGREQWMEEIVYRRVR